MAEPSLSMTAEEDDLPRTIRRERDAREREARERAAVVVPTGPTVLERNGDYAMFFIKAVFAAVPALLLLTAMLWLFGQGLHATYPQLLKMKILIYVPPQ